MGSYRTVVEQLIHHLVSLYLQFRSIASKDTYKRKHLFPQ